MDVASFSRCALECFCRPVLQEIDYLLHYTKNINEFKDQAQRLNAVVSDVKYAVEQAERNREGIKNEVQVWLQRANKKATEAQNLLDNEEQANRNHRCACACCSPDWLSRHKLSKQAVSIGKEMGVICEERRVLRLFLCLQFRNLQHQHQPVISCRLNPPKMLWKTS